MLNARGGFESDLTVMRLSADSFLIVTGSAQGVRDADWIRRNMPEDAFAVLTDVTSAYAVLSLMGPRSKDILSKLTDADLSLHGFPFATAREIDVGYARALANRMSYIGEQGWELIVPGECAAGLYDAIFDAGAGLGLLDAGYYALEAMRIEKGFRAWGRELTPDVNPFQAGLGFAVKLDKPGGFIGQRALVDAKAGNGFDKRIVQFTIDDPEPVLWGGEPVLRDGRPVGELRSAAYGHTLGRSVGLALMECPNGVTTGFCGRGASKSASPAAPVPRRRTCVPLSIPRARGCARTS